MELVSGTSKKTRVQRDVKLKAYKNHVSNELELVRTVFEAMQDLIDVYVDDYERTNQITKLAQIGLILCDRAKEGREL